MILLNVFSFISEILARGGWVGVFAFHHYARDYRRRRIVKGAITKRLIRKMESPIADYTVIMYLAVVTLGSAFSYASMPGEAKHAAAFGGVYWLVILVWDLIDWFTSDDRHRLRKKAKQLVSKLKWAPKPRPVIVPT